MEEPPFGILRPHEPTIAVFHRAIDAGIVLIGAGIATVLAGSDFGPDWAAFTTLGALSFYLLAERRGLYQTWRTVPVRRLLSRTLSTWLLIVPAILTFGYVAYDEEPTAA